MAIDKVYWFNKTAFHQKGKYQDKTKHIRMPLFIIFRFLLILHRQLLESQPLPHAQGSTCELPMLWACPLLLHSYPFFPLDIHIPSFHHLSQGATRKRLLFSSRLQPSSSFDKHLPTPERKIRLCLYVFSLLLLPLGECKKSHKIGWQCPQLWALIFKHSRSGTHSAMLTGTIWFLWGPFFGSG